MANEQNLKPFKKNDPRINRKGRPKSFKGLRELARLIADEKAKSGNNTLVIDGHSITVVEAILRSWAMGKDKRKQQAFIEIAYGKVPDEVKTSGDVEITIKYADEVKRDSSETT